MEKRLLLNIGNTRTQLVAGGIKDTESVVAFDTSAWFSGSELPPCVRPYAAFDCAAACVVPAVKAVLQSHFPAERLRCITSEDVTDLDFSCVDPVTIGADRLANAVAALDLRPPPVIVIDCGTAITIEVIDEQRRFRGGAIMPGRQMLRTALHKGTGQLPHVPMSEVRPLAIGTTTADAIRAGIDLGVVGAVEGLLRATREQLGIQDCTAIATGGDVRYFMSQIPNLIIAPPAFTLRGLARIIDNRPDGGKTT